MRIIKNLLFLALPVLLISCFEKESPVKPFDRGDLKITSFDTSNVYDVQFYYDVSSGEIVSQNVFDIWDLGFECEPDSFHITLNTAKIMQAADFGPIDFSTVLSKDSVDWNWDRPSGNTDSTAIGQWWESSNGGTVISAKHLYLIDRGYNIKSRSAGFKKMMIEGFSNDEYTIRFADLDNKNEATFKIKKNPALRIVNFSFDDGGKVMELEPPDDTWDLFFTRYTHLYEGFEDYPTYGVNGVLINRMYCKAILDTLRPFDEITRNDFDSLKLSNAMNSIGGITWKYFDLESGDYIVLSSRGYLLQDRKGFLYKLNFLEFYNTDHIKGYITFGLKIL